MNIESLKKFALRVNRNADYYLAESAVRGVKVGLIWVIIINILNIYGFTAVKVTPQLFIDFWLSYWIIGIVICTILNAKK